MRIPFLPVAYKYIYSAQQTALFAMDPISDPSTQKSHHPVQALPEELGKPLEDSLDHIVSNSKAVRGARKDQLARTQTSSIHKWQENSNML